MVRFVARGDGGTVTLPLQNADVLEGLRALEAGSVQCCLTSPPFFSLRSYGVEGTIWRGDSDCEHVWGEALPGTRRDKQHVTGAPNARGGGEKASAANHSTDNSGAFCQRCGAWRGALGLEPDPDSFVANLVAVFAEVRRVLRDDGVCFVNIGDGYASAYACDRRSVVGQGSPDASCQRPNRLSATLKEKDLVGIPQRLFLALQEDGWWVRSCFPQAKENPMPESVLSRPTTAHEYWLLLAKSAKYFWDPEAVRQPAEYGRREGGFRGEGKYTQGQSFNNSSAPSGKTVSGKHPETGRNFRTTDPFLASLDVAILDTQARLLDLLAFKEDGGLLLDEDGDPLAILAANEPSNWDYCKACGTLYVGRERSSITKTLDEDEKPVRECPCGATDAWVGHFAAFAGRVIEPLLKAATSEAGCCAACGAAYERVVEPVGEHAAAREAMIGRTHEDVAQEAEKGKQQSWGSGKARVNSSVRTLGFRPRCDCGLPEEENVPCTILDPFMGSGTSALVAEKLGLRWRGIELNPEYVAIIEARILHAREHPPEYKPLPKRAPEPAAQMEMVLT